MTGVQTCALPISSSYGKETYAPPPAGTKSLIQSATATRNADGSVAISGVVRLPRRTKMWVERVSPSGKTLAQAQAFVGFSGVFSAGPFSEGGKAPKTGSQRVRFVSWFNESWQQPEVLTVTGKGGKNLPSSALRPDDREFPDAGRHMEESRIVAFPAVSEEQEAIEHVKQAKLYVQDKGQAVDAVAVAEIGRASCRERV